MRRLLRRQRQTYITESLDELDRIEGLFKTVGKPYENVLALQEENKVLKKQIESLMAAKASGLKDELKNSLEIINGINFNCF